jgi:3-(3-hydroxy-phenyl)propionate hydroxylase
VTHVPVVIVGAGPTGVAAATLVAQFDVECLLLDRWDSVYPQPRAVHVDDEVCRILAQLGIADQFMALSRPGRGLRLLDHRHRVLAEFDRSATRSVHGYPQANMFDQPELEELLRANLARHPAATLRGGVRVTGVVQHSPQRVRVEYTDIASGEEHAVEAAYVLGCDGANSVVRACAGARMNDLGFQQRWLVVDIRTETELGQWDGVHQVCSTTRAGTYMRLGASRHRWEFRLRDEERAEDFAALPALRGLISPWVGAVADERLELVRVAEYTFRAQVADHWRRDRVFLLGDAAHLTPPFIGQGMGAGLRDAMNLAWKLADALSGASPENALDSYQAEREPHARAMIQLARGVGVAMTAGGWFGDLLRRAALPRLGLLPGLRRRITSSETPALKVGPRQRRRGIVGTLCPNPVLTNGKRFDDIVGNRFAVVSAAPLDERAAAVVARRAAVPVFAEPGGELAAWLGRASAAVVRPDRVVARIERPGALRGTRPPAP